jgi:hypothetical protein
VALCRRAAWERLKRSVKLAVLDEVVAEAPVQSGSLAGGESSPHTFARVPP